MVHMLRIMHTMNDFAAHSKMQRYIERMTFTHRPRDA
jgi:hypothetical protein